MMDLKTNKGKLMCLPKYPVCESKTSRFKVQEASRLLSKNRLKTILSKIPLVGDILF